MAAMRGPRHQVGSAGWVAEERSCALRIAQSEFEDFSYSAKNELDWLNEHMAGIFNENETNIAETFKTPGKLRGKTPRTARKTNRSEARVPLADVFGSTPNGSVNRLARQMNRMQSPKLQFAAARSSPVPTAQAVRSRPASPPKPPQAGQASQDSGYYGSQDIDTQNPYLDDGLLASQSVILENPTLETTMALLKPNSTGHVESSEKKIDKEQTAQVPVGGAAKSAGLRQLDEAARNNDARDEAATSTGTAPSQPAALQSEAQIATTSPIASRGDNKVDSAVPDSQYDEVRSPSDHSSPIRPMVRKSSLNFASLPAREPIAAGKASRVSRTSHLDQHRTSYYGRPTGGKSLGTHAWRDTQDDEDHDEMDLDKHPVAQTSEDKANSALNHNKSYTQRLQDQINMLGKSQANSTRPSKSIPSFAALQQSSAPPQPLEAPKSPSPRKIEKVQTTPGAFPEEEDDWIDPPTTVPQTANWQSPRPTLPKSYTADVMEGIYGSDTIGDIGLDTSPARTGGFVSPQHAPSPEKSSGWFGHGKSASVSALNRYADDQPQPLTKAATVSNTDTDGPNSPPKSPSRSFREGTSKQVKNKLSSIIKFSKGLLASSAALSAEGKASVLSPSTSRLALHFAPSSESIIPKPSFESLRSKLDAHGADREKSPTKPVAKRTRASVEREKEEKRREKELKRQEEQMGRLEKAREKEREKARVFSKEQAKTAVMEQQVEAKRDEEKPPATEAPKPTRTSPRKAKDVQDQPAGSADNDTDMPDIANAMLPPSVPRSAAPPQPHATRIKDTKRPVKPVKETQTRTKQAPTVIRVNTGSQHSQYRPSSANTMVNGHETVSSSSSQPQPQQPPSKASKVTLQTKPSTQSLKATASAGRPKALDAAAKKKEQDERDAQRRRDAKAETERKRAAAQEEQRRQEQQRRQDAERQKQKDREQASAHTDAKKNAQRQAIIEKAKQTRAPPPAARPHLNGPPDFSGMSQDQASSASQTARPPSQAGVKRTLWKEATEDAQARGPPSRGGPSYQAKDSKRRRTSEGHDEQETEVQSNIKNPPVRPSAGFKKELPKKSILQSGYVNASQSATRDLFKATVAGQLGSQAKAAHPLDMAQISKGAIPFAPNTNPPGNAHKTPARPGAGAAHGAKSAGKSVPRSSPRFQNGESIELPEIHTDDEDEDDDEAAGMTVASWADSPQLRQALMQQETIDPSQVFGPPRPLNMEEVFAKSKDKFHKFRARTSSANWSGADRLTEDDIRKDLAARDKMRREGGWSYDLSRELM